ncbi:MAG TPA: hypothetical protein VGF28_22255 [Thermoanaerobaculia bacterium]|jgi:hypothetical protein
MRILVPASLLIALPVFAAEPQKLGRAGKASWAWSIDERLAVRFDPELAAKRASGRLKSSAAGNLWSEVNGSESPEIFLPIELFTALLGGVEADGSFRAVYRAGLRDRIIEFGLNEEQFWSELEQVTAPHVQLIARNDSLAHELCSSRADALQRARQHFKAVNFDRFLYTVVAPDLTVTSTSPGGETAEHLRFLAGGCR